MLGLLIACSILALAQDSPRPPGEQPAAAPARSATTPAEADALARYNGIMEKPPKDAAGHMKLAAWCEENGLRPEAYFHYGRVIELDPKRDVAWQKLGFKKVSGRWMTARQIEDEAKQKLADKEWSTKLKKWHKDIHGGRKQAEARAGLEQLADPAAAPSVYREFGGGGRVDQTIALEVLGRIDGPVASKAIATLAVYGKTPDVRRHAIELLRGRPPEEFLDLLVALMKDLMKYEVRPVGGPGSPGVLFVEGERFNVRRFYAPPPPMTVTPRVGDAIGYDANGFPTISRTTSTTIGHTMVGVPGSKTLAKETDTKVFTTETFDYGVAMIEAQRAAMSAQAQLAADVARIDALNETTRQFNELVMTAAQAATGKNPGRTAKEWRDLLDKERGARYASRPATKPTVDEQVPLDYLPNLAAAVTFQSQTRAISQIVVDS